MIKSRNSLIFIDDNAKPTMLVILEATENKLTALTPSDVIHRYGK